MRLSGKTIRYIPLPFLALGILTGCLQPSDTAHDPQTSGAFSLVEKKGPFFPSTDDAVNGRSSGEEITLDATGAFMKEFTLEVPEEGDYYLGAWIDGTPGRDQAILVDGKIVPGVAFSFAEGGWQSAHAVSGKDAARLRLEKGRHAVAVRSSMAAPNVEKLLLGRTSGDVTVPADGYQNYLRGLIAGSKPTEKTGAGEPLAKKAGDDPFISYQYALAVPVNYTWYTWVYLTQGVTYEFATGHLTTGADPVLHLFHPEVPALSWVNDDFSPPDRNAKITITAPTTATYLLLARSYGSSTGTATVFQSGSVLGTACPLAGYRIWAGSPASNQTLNYFTGMKSSSSVDPRIWIFDSGDYMRGQNDDYSGGGTFSWGYNSRIKGSYSDISYMVVSAYSTTSTGTADLYSKLPDAPLYSVFPNLNGGDAIQTSPASQVYNCISWSGAVTSTWHWPPGGGNPWYVAGNPLQTFHNFYSNTCASGGTCKRYADANVWKYGNYSSDPAGRVVALWYNNAAGSYTHASVTKPANALPHGYDWESKPGDLERVLHPRDALNNEASSAYGHIVGYYQHVGYTAKVGADDKPPENISEEESIKRGNSVLEEPVLFTSEEKSALSKAKGKQSKEQQDEFESLYEAWKATFPKHRHQSNPEAYRSGPEFEALAGYCESKGKAAWPQLFEKLESRDPIVGFAVVSLVKGHEDVLEEAVKEWTENQTLPDGKFVIFSPENARMRFAKKLLAKDL
ncbi:MAG: hypothetical protein ABIW76_16065 [Fibrobacteria bacterium]